MEEGTLLTRPGTPESCQAWCSFNGLAHKDLDSPQEVSHRRGRKLPWTFTPATCWP